MTPEAGLEVEVPAPTKIVIKGIDKQRVGEFAANIRAVRALSLTKVKVFVTKAKLFVVKKVKLLSKPVR